MYTSESDHQSLEKHVLAQIVLGSGFDVGRYPGYPYIVDGNRW